MRGLRFYVTPIAVHCVFKDGLVSWRKFADIDCRIALFAFGDYYRRFTTSDVPPSSKWGTSISFRHRISRLQNTTAEGTHLCRSIGGNWNDPQRWKVKQVSLIWGRSVRWLHDAFVNRFRSPTTAKHIFFLKNLNSFIYFPGKSRTSILTPPHTSHSKPILALDPSTLPPHLSLTILQGAERKEYESGMWISDVSKFEIRHFDIIPSPLCATWAYRLPSSEWSSAALLVWLLTLIELSYWRGCTPSLAILLQYYVCILCM